MEFVIFFYVSLLSINSQNLGKKNLSFDICLYLRQSLSSFGSRLKKKIFSILLRSTMKLLTHRVSHGGTMLEITVDSAEESVCKIKNLTFCIEPQLK